MIETRRDQSDIGERVALHGYSSTVAKQSDLQRLHESNDGDTRRDSVGSTLSNGRPASLTMEASGGDPLPLRDRFRLVEGLLRGITGSEIIRSKFSSILSDHCGPIKACVRSERDAPAGIVASYPRGVPPDRDRRSVTIL